MPVTLQDVAAATGYDKSTVSVALRNLPRAKRFSPETVERIHAAARKLGYRPNFFARQLSDQKPRLLMLCLNYLRDPFAMLVAEGFEARAAERGYRVLITALQDREDPLELHRDILGIQGIPAMAAVGGSSSKISERSLVQLAEEKVKIVLINRVVADPRIARVGADDHHGASQVARHVYEQGVRDAWVLVGMEGPALAARERAFGEVARAFGAPEPRLIRCAGIDWADGAAAATRAALREVGRPPQAILTVSDVLAVGTGRALGEAGLMPGRDVALTGFDGGIYAQCCWPPLTTVRLPMAEMGRVAAESLMSMLEHPRRPTPQVTLPVELVIRESSVVSPASLKSSSSARPGGSRS